MPVTAQKVFTEETLEQLRKAHEGKDLHQLTVPTGESVVLRMPSRGEWNRFRAKGTNESKRFEAGEQLVAICLVHPTRDEYEAMLERRPALGESVLSGLLDVAGLVKKPEDVEKKAL